jgi:hypothetical protein
VPSIPPADLHWPKNVPSTIFGYYNPADWSRLMEP